MKNLLAVDKKKIKINPAYYNAVHTIFRVNKVNALMTTNGKRTYAIFDSVVDYVRGTQFMKNVNLKYRNIKNITI